MLKQSEINELFIERVQGLIANKTFRNQREVVKLLKWNETALSSVLSGKRPVPRDKADILFKIYNSGNNTYQNRKDIVAEPTVKYNEAAPINTDEYRLLVTPMVEQFAYAGYLRGYNNEHYLKKLQTYAWLVDKQYKGRYVTFEVRGDSMDSGLSESYKDGDLLLCREIARDLWADSKLHIKKWDFVIVHKTEGILIKRITAHDVSRGLITIHSLNELYADSVISLDEVAQIFNVVQSLRKR